MQVYDDLRLKLDDDSIMLRAHQLGLNGVKDFLATEIRSQAKRYGLENSITRIDLQADDPSSLVIVTINRVADPSGTKAKVRDLLITQSMGGTVRNEPNQCKFYVSIPSLMKEYLSKASRTMDSDCYFECERVSDIINITMYHEGCAIGAAKISVGNKGNYTLTHLEIVLPYQHCGNGRKLLAQVCERMFSDGAERLCFSVSSRVSETDDQRIFFRNCLNALNVPFEETPSATMGPFHVTIYLDALIMAKYGDDYKTSKLSPHQYLGMKLCNLSQKQVSDPRFLRVPYQALRLGLMMYDDMFKLSYDDMAFIVRNGKANRFLIDEFKSDDQLRILACLSEIHHLPQTHHIFLNFVRCLDESVEFDPYEQNHILTRLLRCMRLEDLEREEAVNLFKCASELNCEQMRLLTPLSDEDLVDKCRIILRRRRGPYFAYGSRNIWVNSRLIESSCSVSHSGQNPH